MDVGLGLPTTLPGVTGGEIVEFARRAERLGFASLGVLDRLVYDNCEPLVSLAAAAAVTSRIRLASTILIAAYRGNNALLAKQLATVDRIAGGRLTVGVAAGGRDDDFVASGVPYAGRGRRLDALLADLTRIWSGDSQPAIGPHPANGGLPILVGGHSPAAMRRAARWGRGWIAGGSSASGYAELAGQARRTWAARGRADSPRLVALAYVALGPDARERAARYLRAYYAFIGAKADQAARGVLTDVGQLREHLAEYDKAGCDELILFPCVGGSAQVDLIAEALS
jgi:alkanesulfonate monooxygenase SsuD/methylene tetrahydromethanopterin reductase-like flavin-dependent oxidoreductase (luciferase family)